MWPSALSRKTPLMIRINKSSPPEILTTSGAERRAEHCRLFEKNQEIYLNGDRAFDFDRRIYSHQTVKQTLRRDQHEKCCYCEGKFEAFSHGDIEHYRPKGAVKQSDDGPRIYPGYYWLAYCWRNLYYCCECCNRSSKRELFPLINHAQRARSHADSIDVEEPLILNPGSIQNRRDHIKYFENVAVGVSEFGKTTIDIVCLNRSALKDQRLKRLNILKTLQRLARALDQSADPNDIKDREDAVEKLDLAKEPTAEFSAMAIDYLCGE